MGLFSAFKGGQGIDLAELQMVPGAPKLPSSRGMFAPYAPPGQGRGRADTTDGPAALAMPVESPTGKGPSFWRMLDGVIGGGHTITEMKDAHKAKQALAAKQQQYLQMVEGMGLTPQQKLLALNDPEGFMKALATRESFHDVAGGNTIINGPGGAQTMAPKLTESEGIYGTQTEGGWGQTGARGPSIAETETGRHNVFQEAQDLKKFNWLKKYQGGQLGVSQSNSARGWAAHNARLKGVGGYGTPGVGFAPIDDGDVEIDQ